MPPFVLLYRDLDQVRRKRPVHEVSDLPLSGSTGLAQDLPGDSTQIHVCVICKGVIPEDRAKRAIARGRAPKYDTDVCQSRGKIREAYWRFKRGAQPPDAAGSE